MVFISHNNIRKCKYCENDVKKNIKDGRNKGYYRTCGSELCVKAQYKDKIVCALKGRIKNQEDLACVICGNIFVRASSNHKKYCKECVPDKSWRGRANLYGIGKKQWDLFLINQDDKCALCERIPEVVDHCHKDGIVRGLLCGSCNIQIAKMDKDRKWLKKAVNYIGGM